MMEKQMPEYFTLAEAVSFMAFGRIMDRKGWQDARVADRASINSLMDDCFAEANADPKKYRGFPKKIITAPASRMVEQLSECRDSWTPSCHKFFKAAQRLVQLEAEQDAKEAKARERLAAAVLTGAIELSSQRAGETEYQEIDSRDLRGQEFKLWQFDEIARPASHARAPMTWENVFVDGEKLLNKFGVGETRSPVADKPCDRSTLYHWPSFREEVLRKMTDAGDFNRAIDPCWYL